MVGPSEDEHTETSFEISQSSASSAVGRNPLSLALLFYIVTVCAILAACLRTLIENPAVTGRSLSTLVVLGAALGFVSGAAIGWFYFKRRFGAAVASSVGIIVGAAVGALALVDGRHFLELSGLAFVGCWFLILFMLASARMSKRRLSIPVELPTSKPSSER